MTDNDASVALLLQQAVSPGAALQATEKIKQLMKTAQCIPPLMTQMAGHPEVAVRQLAAVLLRRRLAKGWGSLGLESRNGIKQTLLARLVEDPAHLVRLSIAHIVSSLAKVIFMEWRTELFEFLQKCSDSKDQAHREIAQVTFSSILDLNATALAPLLDEFARMFQKGKIEYP